MLHEQFEHQNVANSIENETFELKNAADARNMDRTGNPKNKSNTDKKNKTIPDPYLILYFIDNPLTEYT